MKFELHIQVEPRHGIVLINHGIGTDDVTRIRQELGEQVPLNRIIGEKKGVFKEVCISLTEEQARESSRFKNANCVLFVAKAVWINGFCKTEVFKDPDGNCGISILLDKDALFKEWINLGCPNEI